ncbi:hypothetical protein GJ744_007510 [Endocarpon pusillum]|uniref:Aminoacyl-transfer RNA synthetases class-II family profile domain-containing protein n=1 Tax=Endocarpon pusillum TaxID=364733 RepID=A0A8H7E633_9EURO|nr:hypothetical protein GJ744_007510 [Endocarpon pusillum]
MQALQSWQSWRLRYLPVVKSIIRLSPSGPSSSSNVRLNSHRIPGCRFIAAHSYPDRPQELWVAEDIKDRVKELQEAELDMYPRGPEHTASPIPKFDRLCQTVKKGETKKDMGKYSYQGRIESVRTAGRLLFFVDMVRNDLKLQVLVNYAQIHKSITQDYFISRRKLLRRGDIITVTGYPHRTEAGQLSLSAIELPCILSPCLHQFPVQRPAGGVGPESQSTFLDKHVEMLANREHTQLIRRRSDVVHGMRTFLRARGYSEVQTPILSSRAGGAIARSFETFATEFSERKLALRVAPELWLKRLILGGMDRIFEIGQCFRNEGLDKTHNPEFTTCEFYSTYASIRNLCEITEKMLNLIVKNIEGAPQKEDESNRHPRIKMPPLALKADFFKGPYAQIDFLLGLNEALGLKLPDLCAEHATAEVINIFKEMKIELPAYPTLPRLLDKLSTTYLEPRCHKPTWIINHPECLSPLSKSFPHPSPDIGQPVAARAELFIHGREIVNCYEEENSPFEQRRKFMMQQRYANAGDGRRQDKEAMEVDEDYLQALEWGLPPTGGWGCGIDRLVMLLTGKQRINDVLTFGNLRSVTRIPETRKIVKVEASFTVPPKPDTNKNVNSDPRREVQPHRVRKDTSLDTDTTHSGPQLDAPEEVFLKIKQKLISENSSRARAYQATHVSSSAEQKLLAGIRGFDAREWLLKK